MSLGKRASAVGIVSAMLLVVAAIGIGCGGGGSNGSSNSGDSGQTNSAKQASGPDEYAAQVCDALSKYANDMNDLLGSNTAMDDPAQAQEASAKMSTMFSGMANDLDKINPPSDIADIHNGLVSALRSMADLSDQMNKALDKPLDEAVTELGDITAKMGDASTPLDSSKMPAGYEAAFKNNAKCQELSILNE